VSGEPAEDPGGSPGNEALMRSWLDLTRESMRAEGMPDRVIERVVHRMVFGYGVHEAPPSGDVVSSGVIG